jgi:hypothetical protein
MLKKNLLIALMAATVLFTTHAPVWACAVCLGGADDSTIEGYNASVLFLMATPYLVLGSIVGALIFTYRRALKKRALAEAAQPGAQLAWNQEDSGR